MRQKPRRINLTNASVEAIEPVKGKRQTIWDTKKPKLCVRVTEHGAKTFYYVTKIQTDNGGKTEWEKLGRYPQTSAKEARTLADIAAGEFARGRNPTEERRQEKAEWTLGKAWQEFRKWRLRKLEKNDTPPEKIDRALEGLDSHLRLRYMKWENKRLSKISEKMAEKLQEEVLEERSAATTNRVIASARAVFNFAIKRRTSGFDGPNPFADLEKLHERVRKTKLQRNQVPDFFAALPSVSPLMQDFILTALWTGRRAGDIKSMRWVDLDLDAGTWLIPDTKTGEPQEVALSIPAIKILVRRRREVKGRWVFPSRSKSGHVEEYKKAWQSIRNRAELGDLRLHDLRRTLSSFAQENRIPATVAGAQLGHKDPATTLKHYTDIALYAQRDAVNVVADAILEAMSNEGD